MPALTSFLLFDGNCADAMAFCRSCLGGTLTVTTVGDTPMKDQIPADQHHKVVNAHLEREGIAFTATDWLHPDRVPRPGNMVGVFLTDLPEEELRPIFDRLAEGADRALLDELRPMPFGLYGHLVDRYGVQWFFRGDPTDTDLDHTS